MGTIVIHAGRPKAGSSSIRRWLEANASQLRGAFDTSVLVALPSEKGGSDVDLERVGDTQEQANSMALLEVYRQASDKRAFLERAFDQIEHHAAFHRTIVLSSDWLALFFSSADDLFLGALDELARRHVVRVAYYLRPQHTALEAAWRQWGFRSGQPPSAYLTNYSQELRYLDTYQLVRARAPRVSFRPRPLTSELLDSGDLVADFARRFLGVDATALAAVNAHWNTGLPLDLVNALRAAPAGLLWAEGDNASALKQVMRDAEVTGSPEVHLSRRILHSHAYKVFEADNARLGTALDWGSKPLIPPPSEDLPHGGDDLGRLDDLWKPKASEAELQLLYHALDKAITRSGSRTSRRREPAASPVPQPREGPSGQDPPCSRSPRVTRGLGGELARLEEDLNRLAESEAWRVGHAIVRTGRKLAFRKAPRGSILDVALRRVRRLRKRASREGW